MYIYKYLPDIFKSRVVIYLQANQIFFKLNTGCILKRKNFYLKSKIQFIAINCIIQRIMLNQYTVLYLSAIFAFNQAMPAIITDSNDIQDNDIDKNRIVPREIDKKIYGTMQHIKAIGITYQQIKKDDECAIEYNNKIYVETNTLKIKKKLYRVENCSLERVYHACGPKLLLMLSIVCRVVEKHKIHNEILDSKRSIVSSSIDHFHTTPYQTKHVIAESCCEDFCTVSELTRYCH